MKTRMMREKATARCAPAQYPDKATIDKATIDKVATKQVATFFYHPHHINDGDDADSVPQAPCTPRC